MPGGLHVVCVPSPSSLDCTRACPVETAGMKAVSAWLPTAHLAEGLAAPNGGGCVGDSVWPSHVWRRSTASGGGGGNCVEVSITSESVLMRHSRSLHGPVLKFSFEEWDAFLTGVRRGEFDTDQSGS
jgi:hypothetical protein